MCIVITVFPFFVEILRGWKELGNITGLTKNKDRILRRKHAVGYRALQLSSDLLLRVTVLI